MKKAFVISLSVEVEIPDNSTVEEISEYAYTLDYTFRHPKSEVKIGDITLVNVLCKGINND